MLKAYDPFADTDPPAPECRAAVAHIQRLLDGETAPDTLDADPHVGVCAVCRARLRAARVLLSVFATPEPVAVPAGFADRTVKAMWDDRHTRTRQGVYKAAAWLALAAAVVFAAFAILRPSPKQEMVLHNELPRLETTTPPEVAPEPRAKTPPAPNPRPIRIGDEFAKAGQAFRDAPKPLTDSVAVAPKLFDAFTGTFTMPPTPAPMGMGEALEPARKSIADLPDAARTGLEPVTGTTQKAFDRLLRDVALVKPKS